MISQPEASETTNSKLSAASEQPSGIRCGPSGRGSNSQSLESLLPIFLVAAMLTPALRRDPVEASLLASLHQLLGERLSTSAAVCAHHGKDESYHAPHAPDAVVFPKSTEEVAGIVKLCADHKTPVIAFGTGTSLEGHVAALAGGVCIDLSQMNRIIRVNREDLDATVEAGVTRKQLNEHLRDTGLFFPIDPGADASLGGMAATRASGTNAVRYGTMRENVLALTVVLADGRIIRTARRARKSAAGYDLTRLFVGSEGTLGIITELTVRLYGIPEAISAAVCAFPNIEGAVDTVILTIQSGIPVARIELLDEAQMDAVNKYSKLDHKVAPTLFFEFHGTPAGVAEQAEAVKAIAGEFGGDSFRWATTPEERSKLWQARHDAYYAALALRPGSKGLATDVCVPISRLAECISETKRDLSQSPIPYALVGHVGDGNFHLVFMIDPNRPEEVAEACRLNDRMVARALAMEGTCTGEHGVGYGKMDFLIAEHGEAIGVMRTIKKALDPDGILNPGKIVRV
jgi:D-lactate dehydrogenase (cytochrome)